MVPVAGVQCPSYAVSPAARASPWLRRSERQQRRHELTPTFVLQRRGRGDGHRAWASPRHVYKLIRFDLGTRELYDLVLDEAEAFNLLERPLSQEVEARLEALNQTLDKLLATEN